MSRFYDFDSNYCPASFSLSPNSLSPCCRWEQRQVARRLAAILLKMRTLNWTTNPKVCSLRVWKLLPRAHSNSFLFLFLDAAAMHITQLFTRIRPRRISAVFNWPRGSSSGKFGNGC
jgi:hypothetical protein